jgi:regulator of replication initiation timing
MRKLAWPIVFLYFLLFLSVPQPARGQELPPELIQKLHTSINVALLEDDSNHWSLLGGYPLSYYKFTTLDNKGLYGLKAFRVLIMRGWREPRLTTEQMNLIVEFVRGGGGLIIGYFENLGVIVDLLQKFGIDGIIMSETAQTVVVVKDGRAMVDHPVTTGVEKIVAEVSKPIVDLKGAEKFIVGPFVAAAKDFGSGRVVFFGDGNSIKREYSGLRLFVNAIEYAAGYTPPGWTPSIDTIVAQLEREVERLKSQLTSLQGLAEENARLQRQLKDLQSQLAQLQGLKDENSRLQSQVTTLQSQLQSLQASYKDLKARYDELAARPSPVTESPTPGLNIFLLTAALIFLGTTIYFARRKGKSG